MWGAWIETVRNAADVVDAASRALSYSGSVRTFNVGTGRGTSVIGLAHVIGDALGLRPRLVAVPPRVAEVPVNVLDCSLARTNLGWAARIPLAEGVRTRRSWSSPRSARFVEGWCRRPTLSAKPVNLRQSSYSERREPSLC